ncbi:DUF72 domain-containing protein [Candidatus Lokiarchaeum ossiferum]|uniref:DUF72 domain-containing protein n=1 Tax=Candidatus Lokiarchaeum ossiferum TaxID=2951803 RepID=UPI00352F873C
MSLEPPAQFLIGTCGWSYKDDWKGIFYPDHLVASQFLEYYSQILPTVEIDSSFYHIPSQKTVLNWCQKTPKTFKFSAKLPQTVTHRAKLSLQKQEMIEDLHLYLTNMLPLEKESKLLAHLIQLPPTFSELNFSHNLESFLNYWNEWRETKGKELCGSSFTKESFRPVVEFRHKSWMKEKTFELLRKYNVAYCAVVEPLLPPVMEITRKDLFYLRFHGYGKKPWWNYNFSHEELAHWASELNEVYSQNPRITHVGYFNNHFSGYAVKNAMDILPEMNLKPIKDQEVVNLLFSEKFTSKKTRKATQKLSHVQKQNQKLDRWFKD